MFDQKGDPVDAWFEIGKCLGCHSREEHVQIARGFANRRQNPAEFLGRQIAITIGVEQFVSYARNLEN